MTDKYVSVPVEISITPNEHTITSNVTMLCAETGRVMAVFYNDYDAEMMMGLIEAAPEPASEEPVAYMLPFGNGTFTFEKNLPDYVEDIKASDWLPLYAHPPAQQWIKCSERMPDVGQPVLVHVIYEYPIVGYITSIGWVCYATDEYIAGEPDFWMPLPQPPEVE